MSRSIKQFVRLGAALFIPLHLAAVLWITMMPLVPFYSKITSTALYRKLNEPFEYYLIATGNAQRWNLFTSVSDIHDQEIIIEATGYDGAKYHFDPILPGLREHNTKHIRHVSLFLRFVYGMDIYVKPYMARAIREIELSGTPVMTTRLLILQKKTRYLQSIRKGNSIAYDDPHEYGPFLPKLNHE